jgi:ribosomal protein S18
MEAQFSEEFKRKFLFIFTKELINNSGRKEMIKLQSIVDERRKVEIITPKETPKQIIQMKPQPILKREISESQKIIPKKIETRATIAPPTRPMIQRKIMPPPNKILFIPEPTLPKHLEYLKPTAASPTENREIDLGKINPLLKDPAVKIIEGSPDERVRVMGTMGTRVTDIFLSKEEIEAVINKFSEI